MECRSMSYYFQSQIFSNILPKLYFNGSFKTVIKGQRWSEWEQFLNKGSEVYRMPFWSWNQLEEGNLNLILKFGKGIVVISSWTYLMD